MSDINSYYMHQAGNGLAGFRGVRYQRGYGFFGRLLSGAVYPMLRFLGKNILKTGKNFAQDIFQSQDLSKENIKNMAKSNIKRTAADLLENAAKKMRGSGLKKRKNKNIGKKIKKSIGIKGGRKRLNKKNITLRKTIKARTKSKKLNKSNLLF